MRPSHKTPKDACPVCEYEVDRASGVNTDTPPQEGDLSICLRCAAVLVFDEDLHLGIFPDDDVKLLHPEDRAAIEAVRDAIRSTK